MIRTVLKSLLRRTGYDIIRAQSTADIPTEFLDIWQECKPFTLTTVERTFALYEAVRHVVANGVPGEIVECGVWRGGSAMAAARTLLASGDATRSIRLFDTFEGMPRPTGRDVDLQGRTALAEWSQAQGSRDGALWAVPMSEVRENVLSTGFPADRLVMVQGKVEETIPREAPAAIAVLRLDTDWYESTRHELTHLYPRLSSGGVLIVDDYGHWRGARAAVDEYFGPGGGARRPFLHRVDYTCRLAIKL